MVSIIIPTYNGQEYIEETIKSCLMQSYKEIEIIVIDDCSQDQTTTIVKKICEEVSYVSFYENKENMGLCFSCNKGASHAKGDYFMFLGQDDILLSAHIETMLSCFESNTSMVWCACDYIDEMGDVFGHCYIPNKRKITIKNFIRNNPISSCGAVISRKAFEQAGGYPENPSFPNYGEWFFWIDLYMCGSIIFCNKIRAKYRRHKSNISNSFTDPNRIIQLNRYWNKCKMHIFDCPESGIVEKTFAVYMVAKETIENYYKFFVYSLRKH